MKGKVSLGPNEGVVQVDAGGVRGYLALKAKRHGSVTIIFMLKGGEKKGSP